MNTARRAIANGFLPDIIGSDLSTITKLSLACLRLTMDFIEIFSTRRRALTDVINACTHTPAVYWAAAELTLATGHCRYRHL